MAQIEGIEKVIAKLQNAWQDIGPTDVSVVVGYTQNYAIYVHENLEAHHPVGQAKYLEQPAREHAREIGSIIRTAMEKSKILNRRYALIKAMLLGGLKLQRESQLLVPVDTGALKGSAFTENE